jgi:hypothetical protein
VPSFVANSSCVGMLPSPIAEDREGSVVAAAAAAAANVRPKQLAPASYNNLFARDLSPTTSPLLRGDSSDLRSSASPPLIQSPIVEVIVQPAGKSGEHSNGSDGTFSPLPAGALDSFAAGSDQIAEHSIFVPSSSSSSSSSIGTGHMEPASAPPVVESNGSIHGNGHGSGQHAIGKKKNKHASRK